MRVISKRTLTQFWGSSTKYKGSKKSLVSWHAETIKANWKTPQEIKAKYSSASILKNNRVVFNIAGNKYHLIISIDYIRQACFVKFVGTHEEYDLINAETYDGYSSNKNRRRL